MRVELRNVTKTFGRVPALRDVTLTLEPGSRTALVGPNGAGKSTLTRVVMGMLGCQGAVRVGGLSPFRDRVRLAASLAYVPQIAPRMRASVSSVVGAIAQLRGLDRAAIDQKAGALGLDLEAVGRRAFSELSGGMKHKLLLALALASEASLVILDEPTASLDARTRGRLFGLMTDLAPETTLVLCSHRLEEICHLVDQVVLLEEARVVYHGPAADFLDRYTESVVEVAVSGDQAEAWLRGRGFRATGGGLWRRELVCAGKVPLVRDLVTALGDRLRDLRVRDMDTISVEQDAERSAA